MPHQTIQFCINTEQEHIFQINIKVASLRKNELDKKQL